MIPIHRQNAKNAASLSGLTEKGNGAFIFLIN